MGGDCIEVPGVGVVTCRLWSGGLFGSRRPHVCGKSSGAGELLPCPCGRGAHQGDPSQTPVLVPPRWRHQHHDTALEPDSMSPAPV